MHQKGVYYNCIVLTVSKVCNRDSILNVSASLVDRVLQSAAQSICILLVVLNQFDQILKVLLVVHCDPVPLILADTVVLHLTIIAVGRGGRRRIIGWDRK